MQRYGDEEMRAVILLATFNGDRYLEEQLDSIIGQLGCSFLLVARDDCSNDRSAGILLSYRQRYPEKVLVLPANRKNLGPVRTFSGLAEYVLKEEDALGLTDYCLSFCDQDDIWEPDKLSRAVALLGELETKQGANQPLLIHSELTVMAGDGSLLHPCYSEYQGLSPSRCSFVELLTQNVVTGCTLTMNTALARQALPIPEAAMMHDWWVALNASLIGSIHYISRPLVRYRQHDRNVIGARGRKKMTAAQMLARLADPNIKRFLKGVAEQAECLRDCPPVRLGPLQQLACLTAGRLLPGGGVFSRLIALVMLRSMGITGRLAAQLRTVINDSGKS